MADWRTPKNLQARDEGDRKENYDGVRIDNNDNTPPAKRSKRLAQKQKPDYKIENET